MTPREYLASLEFHGIKLGLDNIRLLASAAGDPHRAIPVLHVAGTNGKGSVLAVLDAIFRAAGYKTGRYTSPHLINVHERILVSGQPISDADLDRHIDFFRGVARTMDHAPTYFEVITAVAFRHFAEAALDVSLFEVGMGGRFDATNIVEPLATAVTSIDLEHTRYLGATLGQIASEKAGIIKEGTPVVVAETRPEPCNVILSRAESSGAPVRLLGRDFRYRLRDEKTRQRLLTYEGPMFHIEDAPLGMAGRYQGINAAVALALTEIVRPTFPRLEQTAAARGLADARWPCRMEQVLEHPPVILDVAHNPAGARVLAPELPPCVLVLAVSNDKDAVGMIDALGPIAADLILTQFTGPRAKPLHRLCEAAGSRPYRRAETLREAVALGMASASDERPLVITGSIFTAGEARRLLIEEYGAPPLVF